MLSEDCLIPLCLLLICIRDGIDYLVSDSSTLFMAFCEVLHSGKEKSISYHYMAIGKYIYSRHYKEFDNID